MHTARINLRLKLKNTDQVAHAAATNRQDMSHRTRRTKQLTIPCNQTSTFNQQVLHNVAYIHHHAPLGLSTMARTHHGHEAHQCLPNAKRHESLMCSMRQATQTIVDLLRAMGGTPQCGGAPAQQIMLPATRRAK